MVIQKNAHCQIRMDSRWVDWSAACMGFAVFFRAVYYFGLINLRQLNGFELVIQVILPLISAAAYLIVLKGIRLNSPALIGGLAMLFAVNYFFMGISHILAGILLACVTVIIMAAALGYVPMRLPVVAAGMVLILLRVLTVDLFGYILPVQEFKLMAYLPEFSSLFCFLAVGLICPALSISQRRVAQDEIEV